MGRNAGFRYREIVQKLKLCGFVFDRQAAGSHEIWFNRKTNRMGIYGTEMRTFSPLVEPMQKQGNGNT